MRGGQLQREAADGDDDDAVDADNWNRTRIHDFRRTDYDDHDHVVEQPSDHHKYGVIKKLSGE